MVRSHPNCGSDEAKRALAARDSDLAPTHSFKKDRAD